jgi:outer membrane protein TolC
MEENTRPGPLRRVAASLGLILLLAPLLAAQDKPLTLDEAVRLALERNEIAMSNQESVIAANARVQAARSYFFPSISSTGTYTRRAYEVRRQVGDSEVVISRFNALAETLNLNLTLFDARSLTGLAAVRAQRNADVAAAAENQRQLSFEVSQAFLSTLGVRQLTEAAQRRLDYAKQNLDAAKARYAAGLVSINDVTRAELEFATAEVAITQSTGQVETATLQLGYLLAAPEAVRGQLVVPEFLIEAASADSADAEALIEEALARRLDVGSLRCWAGSRP